MRARQRPPAQPKAMPDPRKTPRATACAYFDPALYARKHRVLNALGFAAFIGYNAYCGAVLHAKVVVFSNLRGLDPTLALSLGERIEQGLDAIVPIPQSIAVWALLALMAWMLLLLYLPKVRLTVFG